jgi:hypothetical protein
VAEKLYGARFRAHRSMRQRLVRQGSLARSDAGYSGSYDSSTRLHSYVKDQDRQRCCHVGEHAQEKPGWAWHKKSSWQEESESG